MNDLFRVYWPVAFTTVSILVSIVAQWAILGTRVSLVEERQDRQAGVILEVQTQLSTQAAQYAELRAKIDAMSDNVSYIRMRLDRSLP